MTPASVFSRLLLESVRSSLDRRSCRSECNSAGTFELGGSLLLSQWLPSLSYCPPYLGRCWGQADEALSLGCLRCNCESVFRRSLSLFLRLPVLSLLSCLFKSCPPCFRELL